MIIADTEKTYPSRIRQKPETALAIVDFTLATEAVQHVGVCGQATVEPHDPSRTEHLLSRYLGPDETEWDESRFPDPDE